MSNTYPNKPTTLAELIARVESDNNQFAVRFEPAYHPNPDHVSTLANLAKIGYHSAEILCAFSFGYYQIMGDNLIGMGLQCSPIEYCCLPGLQLVMFTKYCSDNNCDYSLDDIINDQSKREDFAKKYNGPGNIMAYSSRILTIYNI